MANLNQNPAGPSTVLFLAANPVRLQPIQLGEECRVIENMIRAAKFRDQIRFRSRWAARPDDLLQALIEDTPAVLHFSGHGTGNQGLCFQSDDGSALSVSADGLEQVMRAAGASVTVVVLNACFSEVQAQALVAHVPCVIGMPDTIGDETAIIYAGSFYRALAFGKSVANAHQQGLAALALHPADGQAQDVNEREDARRASTPRLLTRRDSDADSIYLVDRAHANPGTASELQLVATARPMLDFLTTAVKMRYCEEAERYTPIQVREDLRLLQWEPRYIFRKQIERNEAINTIPATYKYVQTVNSAHRLVILGEPGSGKSTGLRVAAYEVARSHGGGTPVIVDLNRFGARDKSRARDALIELIHDEANRVLREARRSISLPEIESYLESGQIRVFFDGLNEVPAHLRTRCLQSLIDFCDEFSLCQVVITSRKYMYNGELPYLTMEVLELDREEIETFVERQANDGRRTAQAITNALDRTKWHLLLNPLALHMMVRVFREIGTVPSNRAILIGEYVNILLTKQNANITRAGIKTFSKHDITHLLSSISDLMSANGLCLSLTEVEQHAITICSSTDDAKERLDVAFSSGLLIKDGSTIRFWHHNVQEYFFVLAFYSRWKQSRDGHSPSKKYVREALKRPEKWETISMAAGLMNDEELAPFLRECRRDDYLSAMALNHCGDPNAAQAGRQKVLRTAKLMSKLSYWVGNALGWKFVVKASILLIITKETLRIWGLAFQEAIFPSLLSLGPWLTEDVIQFVILLSGAIVFRRFADYVIYDRFNTLIRALQHLGTPDARAELLRIFRKFSNAVSIDLSYLTVMMRVITVNICTQDELVEGLSRSDDRLYSVTVLKASDSVAVLPMLCEQIQVSRDRYFVEAAIECLIAITARHSCCRKEQYYIKALRHSVVNQSLSLECRRTAYSYWIDSVDPVVIDLRYPEPGRLKNLSGYLFSSKLTHMYLMIALIAIVFSAPTLLRGIIALLGQMDWINSTGTLYRTILLNTVIL